MWEKIQNLFSPPSLAALRNVLTAASVFIGALGIAGLTQAKLQALVDAIMSLGTATAVLISAGAAFVGVLMPIIAGFKSTDSSRAASVSMQPHTMVVSATTAEGAVRAANAIAAIPDVAQVISSPRIADATPSNKIVAAANAKTVVVADAPK